jgi:hypothetical protein
MHVPRFVTSDSYGTRAQTVKIRSPSSSATENNDSDHSDHMHRAQHLFFGFHYIKRNVSEIADANVSFPGSAVQRTLHLYKIRRRNNAILKIGFHLVEYCSYYCTKRENSKYLSEF